MQDLDEEALDSLVLLFDLAQDADPEIRQMANENIVKVLISKGTSSGGGSGTGRDGQDATPVPVPDYPAGQ